MKDWKSLSHVRWDCKYHLVFISKYRHRAIYGELRKKIGEIIRDLCRQKGIELHERACDARSYTPAVKYSAQIQRFKHGGVYKGQKCNQDTPSAVRNKKADGSELLGDRILS